MGADSDQHAGKRPPICQSAGGLGSDIPCAPSSGCYGVRRQVHRFDFARAVQLDPDIVDGWSGGASSPAGGCM